MIHINNVSKSFKKHQLFSNLSFSIGEGTTILTGESGSGKSTLSKIILKNIKPDEGEVIYDEDYDISYTPQLNHLLDNLTIKENIEYIKSLSTKHPFNNERYNNLSNLLNISHLENQAFKKLSDGEKRLFSVIISLSFDYDIYLLDEPLSSIDKNRRALLIKFISEFADDHVLIIVSHEIDEFNLNNINVIDFNNLKEISLNAQKDIQLRDYCIQKKEKATFNTLLKVNSKNIFGTLISCVLLILSIICLMSGSSISYRDDFYLDDMAIQYEAKNSNNDYYFLQEKKDLREYQSEHELTDLSYILEQNEDAYAFLQYSGFLYGNDDVKIAKAAPYYIIDTKIKDNNLYYFQGTNSDRISFESLKLPDELKLVKDGEYEEKKVRVSNRHSEFDRIYLSLNSFYKLLEDGLYSGLKDLNNNEITYSDLFMKRVRIFEDYNYQEKGKYNIKLIEGKKQIGIKGVPINTKIISAGDCYTYQEIFNATNLYFNTTLEINDGDEKTIYLSKDVLLDYLYSLQILEVFSNKNQTKLNQKYNFYSSDTRIYMYIRDNISPLYKIIFLISAGLFFISSIFIITIILLKKNNTNLLLLNKKKKIYNNSIFNGSMLFSLILVILLSSVGSLINNFYNELILNIGTDFAFSAGSLPFIYEGDFPLYYNFYSITLYIIIASLFI